MCNPNKKLISLVTKYPNEIGDCIKSIFEGHLNVFSVFYRKYNVQKCEGRRQMFCNKFSHVLEYGVPRIEIWRLMYRKFCVKYIMTTEKRFFSVLIVYHYLERR